MIASLSRATRARASRYPMLPAVPLAALLLVAGCMPNPVASEQGARRAAVAQLKQASAQSLTAEQRAVLYLNSANQASALLNSRDSAAAARLLYNQAATDLAMLLVVGRPRPALEPPADAGLRRHQLPPALCHGHPRRRLGPGLFHLLHTCRPSGLENHRSPQPPGRHRRRAGRHPTAPPSGIRSHPWSGSPRRSRPLLDFKGRDVTLSLGRPGQKTQGPNRRRISACWMPISPRRSPTTRINPNCGKA